MASLFLLKSPSSSLIIRYPTVQKYRECLSAFLFSWNVNNFGLDLIKLCVRFRSLFLYCDHISFHLFGVDTRSAIFCVILSFNRPNLCNVNFFLFCDRIDVEATNEIFVICATQTLTDCIHIDTLHGCLLIRLPTHHIHTHEVMNTYAYQSINMYIAYWLGES